MTKEDQNSRVSGAQQEHSLCKAIPKHDQTRSPQGCVTILFLALHSDYGQFSLSQNCMQTLYPRKKSFG